MERITLMLENSWQSTAELGLILTTLHAEDERVKPLLRTVDDLRALVKRKV